MSAMSHSLLLLSINDALLAASSAIARPVLGERRWAIPAGAGMRAASVKLVGIVFGSTGCRRQGRAGLMRWRRRPLLDDYDDYQEWRDSLPASLADSAIADRLDELLYLRDAVDQLAAAELLRGFGRD